MTRLFKDRQFVSTAKFTAGLFLIPIIYLIQTAIVSIIFKEWWIALAYFVSLPISLLFTFHYISFLTKQGWFSLKTLFVPGFFKRAKEVWTMREELFGQLTEIEKATK